MLGIFPVIGDEVVHMYRIPDQKSQEAYRILVIWYRLNPDLSGSLVVLPVGHRNHFTGCPVDYFPPALWIIDGVDL